MGPLNWGGREADMEIFIRLLRVVLENAYLVPSGPSPSLSSQPLLCVCVGGQGVELGRGRIRPLDIDTHKTPFYLVSWKK